MTGRNDDAAIGEPPQQGRQRASAEQIDGAAGAVLHARVLPLYLRPGYVLLVGIGGALGTLARYGVGLVIPEAWQLPWPTLTVNLIGAFLLGALIEALARRGHDEGRRRVLRLLVGTGFMGGFTTYSSLAVEASELLRNDRILAAVGYGLTTLVVGLLASLFGMWVAATHHRSVVRRGARSGTHPGAAS